MSNNISKKQIDVSIIIVHTFESRLLRQTLLNIGRAAPRVSYEIIVVDNNPAGGFGSIVHREFPHIRYIPLEKNVGFGSAMNKGIEIAIGRYILIFNPDIVVLPNALESMVDFMDSNQDIGICGPQLKNPDGSLQYSCYRSPTIPTPLFRRTPLGKLPFGRREVERYLMMHEDHAKVMEVDSLIGAALFTRASALQGVGCFDERFFMYYEDNDLCRRFWEKEFRVVYYPKAQMIHYHRRASADGGFWGQLINRFAWIQIMSAIKYFAKYWRQEHPRRRVRENIAKNM